MALYDAGQLKMDIIVTGIPQATAGLTQVDTLARKAAGGMAATAQATVRFDQGLQGVLPGLKNVKGVLAAWGLAEVAMKVHEMTDAWTNLTAKLKLVTAGGADLAAVQGQLLRIAQDSRQDLDSVVTLYARMARATQDARVNQDDLLTVTKSLSQALAISGATTQEAQNAIVQLSQGMALGTLRGQDLKSVLEETPAIGQYIAKGMGVSFGELRKLAEENKITTSQIIASMKSQADQIQKDFKNMPPTVGQAFTEIGNAALTMIGKVDQAFGASRFFARLLEGGARGIEAVTDAFGSGYSYNVAKARKMSTRDLVEQIANYERQGIAGSGDTAFNQQLAAMKRELNRRKFQSRTPVVVTAEKAGAPAAAKAASVSYSTHSPDWYLGSPYTTQQTTMGASGTATTVEYGAQTDEITPRESTMGAAIADLQKEFNERMTKLGAEAQERASAVGSLVGNSLASGIAEAVRSGDVGAGFEALGKAFLGGLGGILQQMGEQLLIANKLLLDALTFKDPFSGIAAAIALIALGGVLQGLAGRGGSGSVPVGAGSGAASTPGGGTIINRGTIAGSLVTPTGNVTGSVAAGASMIATRGDQYIIIGSDDPRAQTELARMVAKAKARGLG